MKRLILVFGIMLIILLAISTNLYGDQWFNHGSAGFSASKAYSNSLAINSSGTAYVAYQDEGISFKATVMKFNGASWETVGIAGFSAGQIDGTSLVINSSGTPYVAYQDKGNSNKATVMKFNGETWETVGIAGFSAGTVAYTSLAIAPNEIPVVAYQDDGNSGKATVMKYSSSGSSSLPVTLSTFTAQFIENTPTLYWETQSETDNMGWNIYRNNEEDFASSLLLTEELIPGRGTITEPSYYTYSDIDNLTIGQTYYYWLESIDYCGISQVYNRVAQITIPDPSVNPPDLKPPIVYEFKNVPNPVSTTSKFQFTLDRSTLVSVSIYNIKGNLVRTLPLVLALEDETSSIYWNCKDNSGKELTPGVYIYNLIVNGKTEEMKKLILMK